MIVDNPGNLKPITEFWAFVSQDKNGNEGIIALGNLAMVQMDRARLEVFKAYVKGMKAFCPEGVKLLMIKMSSRETIEEL